MLHGQIFFSFISHLDDLVANSGYILLVALTLLEGIPLVGMLVPGHVAIVAAGFMARIGTLNLYWVIILAVTGAILGDYMGFYIGRRYGMNFISKLRRYLYVSDENMNKALNLLNKHTFKAMLAGRFTPATRALMPFLIGTTNLSSRKFWLYNIIGAMTWVLCSVMLGYLFGTGYHLAAAAFGKMLVFAILVGFIIIWGYKFVNIRFRVFRRYELLTLIINIIALIVFAGTLQKVTDHAFRLDFDLWINTFFIKINMLFPWLPLVGKITSAVGGVYSTTLIGLVLGLWFLIKHKWRSAAVTILSISSTAFAVYFLKGLYLSPRPSSVYAILSDPSFPSGHAALSASLLLVIAYFLAPKIHSVIRRELMITGLVILTILVGLSRLVLNVHWASDVIAGWSLGIFFSTASILFVRYASFFFIKKSV